MKNIGVILAGGSGHRMHNELPKQFLILSGKTILAHSIQAFQQHTGIDEIYIITHPDYMAETQLIVNSNSFTKVTQLLAGGCERYHSTLAALEASPTEECNLIIHDAVRPLVSNEMISNCMEALIDFMACTIAIPSTDTILVCDKTHNYIEEIPSRDFLFNVQTPQAFRKSVLQEAYRIGRQDPAFSPTDDCGVVKKYSPATKIKIIKGNSANLKITYPEDLITAEKLLSSII